MSVTRRSFIKNGLSLVSAGVALPSLLLDVSQALAQSSAAGLDTSGNLLQRGAILGGSSFQGTINRSKVSVDSRHYFTRVTDDNPSTSWTPMESTGPHWLEMRWRYPVRINAFGWNGQRLGKSSLQSWSNGEYVNVVDLQGEKGQANFPEILTDRLRFSITEFTGKPVIFELLVNGPQQPLTPAVFPKDFSPNEKFIVNNIQLEKHDFKPGDTIGLSFDISSTTPTPPDCFFIVELREKSVNDYFRERFGDFEIAGTTVQPASPSSSWRPGQAQKMTATIELPPYAPDGETAISIMALTGDGKFFVQTENPAFGSNQLAPIRIRRDGVPQNVAEYPQTKLAAVNGQRGFQIGSQFRMPFFKRYMQEADFERFHDSRADGIDIQYFLMYSSCIRPRGEWQQFLDRLDQQITNMLRVRPESYFMVGMDLRVSSDWLRENAQERMLNRNGEVVKETPTGKGWVSFGSPKYLQECLAFVDMTIDFLKSKSYGGRIIGYHPWTNTKNDAFIAGAEPNLGVKDRSKILVGDFHPGAIQLFREWLQKKYQSVEELRRAWNDEKVTFQNALPDATNLLTEDIPSGVFRDPLKSRAAIDYITFFPTLIGGFHQKIAARIKERTNRQALVMIHYGAIIHNLALAQPSGVRIQSNNFDYYNLLQDDNIDMYVQATPYNLRHSGDPIVIYHPIQSLTLNNRMYLEDYDTRTIACGMLPEGELLHGRHRSQYETKAMIHRDLGWLMIKDCGAWLSDMSRSSWREWIEYRKPWFATPEVTGPTREITELFQKTTAPPKQSVSEIAVVLSIDSPAYEDALNANAVYRSLATQFLREELTSLGAPYDTLLVNDLNHPGIRQDYKLYVFINPFYMTDVQRSEVEKLKRDGKTLMWFYAPGYVSDKGLSVEAVSQITGIATQIKAAKTEQLQMKVGTGSHPLIAGLENTAFKAETTAGVREINIEVVQPVFYVDDPQTQALANYADGKVAWAARDFGAWKSIYSAVPLLNAWAIRNIARYAGVHLYCDEPVVMGADNRFLIFNNGYESKRTITVKLPKPQTIKDAFSGETVASGKTSFSLALNTPDTRILVREPIQE